MGLLFIIDSADGTASITTSVSNFAVKLGNTYYVKNVKFKKIVLPFSWYPIDSTNSAFILNENGTPFNGTIGTPAGWDGTSIAAAWQTALNAIGGISNTYAVAYNSVTAKFTVSRSAGAVAFGFNWATAANTLNKILGFNLANDSTGATQVSANVSYVNGPPYVVIKSKKLVSQGTQTNKCFYKTATIGNSADAILVDSKNVFITCPVTTSWGGLLQFNEGDFTREIDYSAGGYGDMIYDVIDFQVVNPWTDSVINMNGANWMIEFESDVIK